MTGVGSPGMIMVTAYNGILGPVSTCEVGGVLALARVADTLSDQDLTMRADTNIYYGNRQCFEQCSRSGHCDFERI
jgi:hypothetical protein